MDDSVRAIADEADAHESRHPSRCRDGKAHVGTRVNGAAGVVQVNDAYFSLKTLAGYSGLSVRRLRDCLTDRRYPLPFYRIGSKILVRRSDFDAWAAQFRIDAVSIDGIVDELAQGLL